MAEEINRLSVPPAPPVEDGVLPWQSAGDSSVFGCATPEQIASHVGAVIGPSPNVSPAPSLNNRIAVFDGPTGKLVKDGQAYLSDLERKLSTIKELSADYEIEFGDSGSTLLVIGGNSLGLRSDAPVGFRFRLVNNKGVGAYYIVRDDGSTILGHAGNVEFSRGNGGSAWLEVVSNSGDAAVWSVWGDIVDAT